MKLFSFRIRAISVFTFDTGMSTRRCFDPQALRMRVSMSAIGSVILIVKALFLAIGFLAIGAGLSRAVHNPWPMAQSPLPAGFSHARNHSGQRELSEAD